MHQLLVNAKLPAMLLLVASAHAAVVTTNLHAPFTDTVVVSNATRSEVVKLSGQLFVLTQVTTPPSPIIPPNPIVPITVSSLVLASGVGQTTGAVYLAAGASQVRGTFTMPGAFSTPINVRLVTIPPDPITPPNPIVPPNPITLDEVVNINSQGTATGASVPPLGLVSWWKADGNAADAVGTNPGTLQGSVLFPPGRVGQAFNFAGSGFVEVHPSPTLRPAAVTAMAWVRHMGVPGPNNYVLSQGALGCTAASYSMYTSLGNLFFGVFDGNTLVQSPDAGPGVWDGNWHLVAGTYDGAAVRLYVDGAEVLSGTPASIVIGYSLLTSDSFFIGAYRGPEACELGFNGDIDEVRIFNRALSAAEIQNIFSSTR